MKKLLILIFLSLLLNINLSSQCYPDRHNTTWYDGWISCETSVNPNAERGESHWILYNLGYTYHLGQMQIWNSNAPDYLADGIKTAAIDVSVDGVNWTEVGEFEFEQASGKSIYEGFQGPDLSGYEAKYLLITALSNWGGFCYGLSEVKVEVHGITNTIDEPRDNENCLVVNVFPNPVSEETSVDVLSYCGGEEGSFALRDITGRIIDSGAISFTGQAARIKLLFSSLKQGTYILEVKQKSNVVQEKIIKLP